jgi:hypothetical protein
MAKVYTLNRTGSAYIVDTGNPIEGGPYGTKLQSFFTDIVDSANGAAGGVQVEPSPAYSTPTAGQTVALSTTTSNNIVNPAGTLATLTVTVPTSPVDGQVARILFTQAVTALTMTGVTPALSAAVAGSTVTLRYRAASSTWFRG